MNSSCTFCGETGITFPHTCKPEETRELPWTVDAQTIRRLLLDMHEPNCPGDGCEGENPCSACLCRHALYRLTKKVDAPGEPVPCAVEETVTGLCSTCGKVHILPKYYNRFDPYEALDSIIDAVDVELGLGIGHSVGDRIKSRLYALRAYITGLERG